MKLLYANVGHRNRRAQDAAGGRPDDRGERGGRDPRPGAGPQERDRGGRRQDGGKFLICTKPIVTLPR